MLKQFFANVNWESVSSNLERLPYMAWTLGREKPKHKPQPAADADLFPFAAEPGWKEQRDPRMMKRMDALIADYETALRRLRFQRHGTEDMRRRNDVQRILFSRGQENLYTVDELYAAFDEVHPTHIRKARRALTEQNWHLTPPEERMTVLNGILPAAGSGYLYMDLFCDFRCGGYRVLGDILCDLDDYHRKQGIEQHLIRSGDSEDLRRMLRFDRAEGDYKRAVIRNCRAAMQPPDAREQFDFAEAVKCAVALGKRAFVLEVLPGAVLTLFSGPSQEKPKRKGLFRR